MAFFNLVLVLSLIAVASIDCVSNSECLTPPLIQNFNAENVLGDWYEIKRFDMRYERGMKCSAMNFRDLNKTDKETNIYLDTKAVRSSNNKKAGMTAIVTNFVAQNPNSFFFRPDAWYNIFMIQKNNFAVWSIDLDNAAVLYSCDIMFGMVKTEGFWIVSRSRTLNQTNINSIIQDLLSKGVDVKKFIDVDQTNC